MFLFKNTKSLVKRIAMNMAVYGFACAFTLMMLAPFLPEVIANYVYVLMVVCSITAIIGLIIAIVRFFIELFGPTKTTMVCDGSKTTSNKAEHKGICLFHEGDRNEGTHIELRFENNGEISIVDTGWWPAHRGASNGGQYTIKLDSDYFIKNSIGDFVKFLTGEFKKDFSHIKNREDIICLFATPIVDFTNNAIALMSNSLKSINYDIEFVNNSMTIVKHSEDPWNHFNKFTAKSDGVYNYVEVQMGGYDEKKRVSCCNFETACFLTLALFISREKLHIQESLLLAIKQYADAVIDSSSDCWRGQFIIDELISLTK